MERHQIETKLKPMVGNSFTYRKDKFLLKGFEISGTHVKLELSGRPEPLVIHKDDFRGIVEEFYPASDEVTIMPQDRGGVNPYTSTPVVDRMSKTMISQNAGWISETIKNNIEQLKGNPAFIPQADAINNQVKSFLDLCKTEVDMQKAINRIETAI